MKCKIVVGANYGDEGKGMVTASLTRNTVNKNQKVLNVLYNGGCQRGHTVQYSPSLKHVYKHFGSGTIDGADTYFNKDFMLNPIQFVKEHKELSDLKGTLIKAFAHRDCRVSTPWDMMLNQMIETKRDKNRHGSCGWGIFETRKRYEKSEYNWSFMKMRCANNNELYNYLEGIAKTYLPRMFAEYDLSNEQTASFVKTATSSNTIINYIEDFRTMCKYVDIIYIGDLFKKYDLVIYEGGQGLALSETNKDGFPHLTPSKTGSSVPVEEVSEFTKDIEVCYITRTYLTRHGAGTLKGECDKDSINPLIEDKTNIHNEYQKSLRFAPLVISDLILRTAEDGWLGKQSLHITQWNYAQISSDRVEVLKKYYDKVVVYDNPYGDT